MVIETINIVICNVWENFLTWSCLIARKHVLDEAIAGRAEPSEGQEVVKVVQADGGYFYRVQVACLKILAPTARESVIDLPIRFSADGTRAYLFRATPSKVQKATVGEARRETRHDRTETRKT